MVSLLNCRAQRACSVRSSACSRCALILEGTLLPLVLELLFQRSHFNLQGLNSCPEIDHHIQESCWRGFLPSIQFLSKGKHRTRPTDFDTVNRQSKTFPPLHCPHASAQECRNFLPSGQSPHSAAVARIPIERPSIWRCHHGANPFRQEMFFPKKSKKPFSHWLKLLEPCASPFYLRY